MYHLADIVILIVWLAGIVPSSRELCFFMSQNSESIEMQPKDLIPFFIKQAEVSPAKEEKARLYSEVGFIYECQVGDLKQALNYYQKALGLLPNHIPFLKVYFQALKKAQAWQDAVQCLEHLIQALPENGQPHASQERAAYIQEQANLYWVQLKQPDQALQGFQKVLALNPHSRSAQTAIQSILIHQKNWQALAEHIRGSVQNQTDDEAKLNQMVYLADLYWRQLNQPEPAIEVLQAALQLKPDYLLALQKLQEIHLHQGNWQQVAEAYESLAQIISSDQEAHQALAQAAEIWVDYLGQKERGLACLENILKKVPHDWETLEKLRRHYQAAGQWEDVQRILSLQLTLVQELKDPNWIRSLRFSLAEAAEQCGDVSSAMDQYQLILKDHPRDLPALKTLGTHYVASQNWQGLSELYENELQVIQDPAQVLSVLLRLSVIYERMLKQFDKAIECYQKAIQLWPQNPLLLWEQQRLLQLSQNWQVLLQSYEEEVKSTQDSLRKQDIYEQIAEIAQNHFQDGEKAIQCYQEILKLSQIDQNAFKQLRNLFENAERWADLATLLGQQIERTQNPAERVGLYLKAGEIFDQKLGNLDSAIFCYQKALELIPHHIPTIHALGSLYSRKEDWKHLIWLFQQELKLVQDPAPAITDLLSHGTGL